MVDLNITSLAAANRIYGIATLDNRHLAAMAAGKDTCGGDSGGPLFDLDADAGNPLLAGITSYGLGCASRDIPGIYANVGNYAVLLDAFLAETLAAPPSISVFGRGLPIADGSTSVSAAKGTHFGRPVRARRSVVKRFTLSNGPGGTPLSIASVAVSNPKFSVVSSPPYLLTGKSATIAVRYRGPLTFRRGLASGRLIVRSSDPANPTYSFKLLARYIGR